MLTRMRSNSVSRRAYSIASKSRGKGPSILKFESPQPKAIPTARSTPADVPTPGTSTLSASKRTSLPVREPPLVERAKQKSVKQRNVFESYLVLNWKTRLYLWLGIGASALVGLYGGDYLVPETDEGKDSTA
ncbi:uncharacterized protein JCM6883_006145 [Sporobolomyces salmoneus]|uniref:uncharacterized protein n=1 Tax=Sporobolomyces salmoneus TaxID=183962 RepID=UPI003175D112